MAKIKEKMQTVRKKMISLVLALANKIIDELGLKEAINEAVEWDKDHWAISPGALAKGLVLSTFTDMRVPLTHLQERLYPMDLGYLLGEEAEFSDINSFNAGRALERIGESDFNRVYESLALTAIQNYNIPVTRTHSDTTTVSFYGEYDVKNIKLTEEEEKELLQIEKGYNKDGRPGCNQAVVGQIVNEHGIPLVNRVMDGSTSDVEWNKEALKYLEEIRSRGFQSGIYVADSKLVIQELVTRMNNEETYVAFVSRCPANFEEKLESRMIKRAYECDQWEELGQIGAGKNASHYRGISFIEPVCGSPMRLLVLESSALAEKAQQWLEKEELKVTPLVRELEKKEFACQADAEKEYIEWMGRKELRLFDCTGEIVKHVKEKWPRGRRSAKTCPTVTETYQVQVEQVCRNEEACCQYLRNESCIVLISSSERQKFFAQKKLRILQKSGKYDKITKNLFAKGQKEWGE